MRPLTSFEEAEYLAHEVPDVSIPPATLTALGRAGPSTPSVGVDLAVQLAAGLRGLVSGVVITPATHVVATTRRIMAC